jgi:hypothetical protein
MVCLAAGAYWIAFDPRPGGLHIEVLAAAEFDLAGHFRMAGYKVVETRRHPSRRHWPLMAATCVGAVKRILGIAAPWVLTPRQLYDHLTGKEI